jgi:UDP-N-acetylmuramyl pentapeptide phosphotransferase/UDP-N-acetylglucosamine-1-phosphate transferase
MTWIISKKSDVMSHEFPLLAISFTLLTALAWLLVGGIRRWARRKNILDIPNERSSHSRPTPRGGGLAIVVLGIACWVGSVPWWQDFQPKIYFGYLGAAIVVAAISWLDDVRGLSSLTRFAAHSLAAGIILLTCGWGQSASLPWFGDFSLGVWGIPLTFLWIVGLTNAYNFMDGIDGIAAGQALVAGIGWMFLGFLLEEPAIIMLGTAIAAANLGFLFHNWPPAKIFMGDVGSAYLGFTFAFLAVWCGRLEPRLALWSALFIWPFAFDSIFTFFRRLGKGENVFAAHRSHLYQRLVQSGMTHGQVSALYIVLAAAGLLPLIADYGGWNTTAWSLAAGLLGLGGSLWAFTHCREKLAATQKIEHASTPEIPGALP